MSTNVAKLPEGLSRADLIKLSGNLVSGSTEYLAGISINKEVEDFDGKDVPDVGRVYSIRKEPVEIRPFVKAMRYEKWVNETNSRLNTSVFFSWGEEIIDELGGTDKLDKVNNDDVKCKHLIYCTVSYAGKTADGKAVSVDNFPVLLRVGGASFSDVADLFKELGQDRILMQHPIMIEPYKSGPAYNFRLSWKNLSEEVDITAEDFDTLNNFRKEIDFNNKGVQNKFKAAQRGNSAPKVEADDGEYSFIDDDAVV